MLAVLMTIGVLVGLLLPAVLLLGEIATGLGDDAVRTSALEGPVDQTLREHPDWAYAGQFIDPARPMNWGGTTKHSNMNGSGWARGYRWADGMPLYTAFNTILPPNTAIVLTGAADDGAGVFSTSSRHQGGANVCFGDGAVRFISDSIDAGDRSQSTVYLGGKNASQATSPYGVWGSFGNGCRPGTGAAGRFVRHPGKLC